MNKEEIKENLKCFYKGENYEIPVEVVNNLLKHIETLQKGYDAIVKDLCDTAEELEKVKYQLEAKEQKIKDAINYINGFQELYKGHLTTDLDEWQMEEEVKRILGE